MLVPLRPSSEHILIVRAPGARDQHGCHSSLTLCEHEVRVAASSPSLQVFSFYLPGIGLIDLPLRATFSPAPPLAGIFTRPALRLLRKRFPETCHEPGRGESATARCASTEIISPHPLLFFVARLAARRRNSVALALFPKGFARDPENLRTGRAAAVYSLQYRQNIVFLELFPRRRQRGQRTFRSCLPRQSFATKSAGFL